MDIFFPMYIMECVVCYTIVRYNGDNIKCVEERNESK